MMSRRFRTAAIISVSLPIALALITVIALPRLGDYLIRARIASLAARAGYQLDYDRVLFSLPNRLSIEHLSITDQENTPVLSAQWLDLEVDRRALFIGGTPVTAAVARGVRLAGHPSLAGVAGTIEHAQWESGTVLTSTMLTGTNLRLARNDGESIGYRFEAARVMGELSHSAQSNEFPEAPGRSGLWRYLDRAGLTPSGLSVEDAVFELTSGEGSSRRVEVDIEEVHLSRVVGDGVVANAGAEVRGDLQLAVVRITLPSVAADVIEFAPLRYQFSVIVNAEEPLSPTRLVRPLPVTDHGSSDGASGSAAVARPIADDGAAAPVASAAPRGSVVTTEGLLEFGGVTMEIRPTLRGISGLFGGIFQDGPASATRDPSFPDSLPARIELQIDLPMTRLSDLHAVVPAALLGDLSTVELDGRLAWRFDLEAPTNELGRMQWRAETQLEDFAIAGLASSIDVARLTGPFIHRIVDPTVGFDRTVRIPATFRPPVSWLGEQSGLTDEQIDRLWNERTHRSVPQGGAHRFDSGTTSVDPAFRFVPLTQMSPWVVRAILTGEDGDFFHHGGVNWNAVRRAIERNVQEGAFVVGASTIPMQLVKNIFLSHDRLMARKLQEVALVFLMEQAAGVSKERILELYLNLIEFGPGVFGIHDAAQYYFDKHPRGLTAIEAVWLASIVPNPKRFHFYFERGEVTEGWFTRMQQYLDVMLLRGRMTEEEYLAALQERPQFARR